MSQVWRRLRVKGVYLCQITWIIRTNSASSRARLLASDPAASLRISSPVSSAVRSAALLSVFYLWPPASVFLLSQLRGPGERPVGMPTIPNRNLVFISGMKNDFPVSLCVKQALCPWFLSAVCVLKCRTANQSMTPYLKENLPKRLHFAYNNRIERGHLYMKSGWQAALWVSSVA